MLKDLLTHKVSASVYLIELHAAFVYSCATPEAPLLFSESSGVCLILLGMAVFIHCRC